MLVLIVACVPSVATESGQNQLTPERILFGFASKIIHTQVLGCVLRRTSNQRFLQSGAVGTFIPKGVEMQIWSTDYLAA